MNRNSVLEEVLDKISDLAGEALDNGDAGKGDHWYYRIHGLEDAAHAVRSLRTPVEPVLPSEASTSSPSPQEQGKALPMYADERLPGIAVRLRRLAELVGIERMAEASMALGDANYLDDLPAALSSVGAPEQGIREALEEVLNLPLVKGRFRDLDLGIGTKLPEGIALLKARAALSSVGRGGVEPDPLRQAAAHLAAFDWELLTSPASPDLNARILALRAELGR